MNKASKVIKCFIERDEDGRMVMFSVNDFVK